MEKIRKCLRIMEKIVDEERIEEYVEEINLIESYIDLDKLETVLNIIIEKREEKIRIEKEEKEMEKIGKVLKIIDDAFDFIRLFEQIEDQVNSINIKIISFKWKEEGGLQDETMSQYFYDDPDDGHGLDTEYSLKFGIKLEFKRDDIGSDELYINLDLSIEQESHIDGDKIYFWTEINELNSFEHNLCSFFSQSKSDGIIKDILYLSEFLSSEMIEMILND